MNNADNKNPIRFFQIELQLSGTKEQSNLERFKDLLIQIQTVGAENNNNLYNSRIAVHDRLADALAGLHRLHALTSEARSVYDRIVLIELENFDQKARKAR